MLAAEDHKATRKATKNFLSREFAKRLDEACDAAGLPGFRAGRQSMIAKEMGVTAEASRRWFAGESIPRVETIHRLAKFLRVDPSWLGAVDSPAEEPKIERREIAGGAEGAALIVAGMMQLHGAAVSFSLSGMPDFIAIRRGRQYAVNVVALTEGSAQFPPSYDSMVNIVVLMPEMVAYEVPHDLIAKARLVNARRAVQVVRTGLKATFDGEELPPLDYARF
jgi:transcriptional regulator with XRE-family HTH domain